MLESLPRYDDDDDPSDGDAPPGAEDRTTRWAIELDDLAKHYGDIRALDGVSLQVKPGEVFGLLGHNGAGKSTMIRILTGRARPTAGQARVLGHRVPEDLEAVRGEINLVAEAPNVYKRSTARENLLLFCTLYGVGRHRADEVLEQVRLTSAAKRKVKEFSTGMRQRLLLARALLNEPRVLFLDEPTRGLDPRSAQELHQIVTDLASDGVTVFLTTHDMNEADELCDRVAFLADGKLVALDTPQALKLGLEKEAPAVDVTFADGEAERHGLETSEERERLAELVGSGRVRALHSREPTLADVFIDLAGRSLDEDPEEHEATEENDR